MNSYRKQVRRLREKVVGGGVYCPVCSHEPVQYTVSFGASAVPPGQGLPIDDQDQADPDERCPVCGRRLVETFVIGWGAKTKAGQEALRRNG